MSFIKLAPNASGTGALTIAAPNTNTDVTFNLGTALGNNAASALVSTDNAGNLGLGVTPSAWGSNFKAIELANGTTLTSTVSGVNAVLAGNSFNDGTGWKYKTSTGATYYNQAAGVHQWFTAPSGTAGNAISFTQAMTLDASGNLGVGTTSPNNYAGYGNITLNGSSGGIFDMSVGNTRTGSLYATSSLVVLSARTAIPLVFETNALERARIDSSGNLLIGKTTSSDSTAGSRFASSGLGVFTRVSADPLAVVRLDSDGDLVTFYRGPSGGSITQQGSISVSGTTVSYNGGHLSRWAQTTTAKDESLLKGTVLSNLDEMNQYVDADGNPVENEQLNKVKVSDVEGDANVAGVFVNWTHDEAHNVDEINMAMTGDMIIRIAQGVTVQRGDLLMSAGDGTAKPQGDDIVRSKTVAKVTSTHVTCTYADGSFCVPCVLMAC